MANQTIIRPGAKNARSATQNGGHDAPAAHAPHLSAELHSRLILGAITAFRDGDFSVRLPGDWTETEGEIAVAFNQLISQQQRISKEVTRLSETVGKAAVHAC